MDRFALSMALATFLAFAVGGNARAQQQTGIPSDLVTSCQTALLNDAEIQAFVAAVGGTSVVDLACRARAGGFIDGYEAAHEEIFALDDARLHAACRQIMMTAILRGATAPDIAVIDRLRLSDLQRAQALTRCESYREGMIAGLQYAHEYARGLIVQ